MIARLFNAPTDDEESNAMGVSTVGSSEVYFLIHRLKSLLTVQAIMLATLAMKKKWQNKRKAEGKDYSKPNIIMNSAVQVCWEYVMSTNSLLLLTSNLEKQLVTLKSRRSIGTVLKANILSIRKKL